MSLVNLWKMQKVLHFALQGCTRAMDCVQQHMTEAIEFIKDWHFVARSSNVSVAEISGSLFLW